MLSASRRYKKVFCFFDHTTTNTHNLMTFRFLPVVETIFIDHTSTTENRLQKLLSNVEKDLFQTLKKHFYPTFENTLAKRLKTFLPNVGKHSCQTLGNIFAKGLEMSDDTYITYHSVKFLKTILAVVDGWSIETASTTT